MAFWIKKSPAEKSDLRDEVKKKKDEKKGAPARRVDNLRIPQQLRISLKSIGAPNIFEFRTRDLSATGAFVLCPDFLKYPFQQASTIIECLVELKGPHSPDAIIISFMAKVARIVEPSEFVPYHLAGFGIRIVYISLEQRVVLENYIARHGQPEGSTGEMLNTMAAEPAHA